MWEFCCRLTKSNWKLFRTFKLETRSLAREGKTQPSGRRIDLDTIYNTLRWVENFDKTHSEGCNKQMNIILGTPMGWPLVDTTLRWVENFDKTHSEGCNKQMNIILGTPMGWPLVDTMHGY